jgi:N utilization substance protein A
MGIPFGVLHHRGPQVILSRTAPEFLVRPFELEVPRSARVVKVLGAACDPGSAPHRGALDGQGRRPVGACVGMKGCGCVGRPRTARESGHRPDTEDVRAFLVNISPAVVDRVEIDEARHTRCGRPDDQLSSG